MLDLRTYIRRGYMDETPVRKTVLKYGSSQPEQILLLLEGKARRKTVLGNGRLLYANYYPVAMIGLEDFLLGRTRAGAIAVYPNSHYFLWDGNDFLRLIQLYPELAARAVFELSRRIRVYDAGERVMEADLRLAIPQEFGHPEPELYNTLYELSFSDTDEFPPHLVERLARTFQAGEAIVKQGDHTKELYILLHGTVSIFMTHGHDRRLLDTVGPGELLGEMAQFDGLPRSADIIANSDVTALQFKPEDFFLLFQLHPRWSLKLLRNLALRIDQRLDYMRTMDLAPQ